MLSRLTEPVDRGPADHRREGAGGAADDDVLRRPPLQPHRVDEDVEGDGEGQQRAGHPVDEHARASATEPIASMMPKVSASSGVTRPRGMGRLAVRCMQRVDVGVVPHVERAGGAGADGDAEERDDGEHGMQLPGASTCPTSAVNTTSDITRGFIRATKSPTLPPPACTGARARLTARFSHVAFANASTLGAHRRSLCSPPTWRCDARRPQ